VSNEGWLICLAIVHFCKFANNNSTKLHFAISRCETISVIVLDFVSQLCFSFNLLCLVNKLIEEGFYYYAGSLRTVPVTIGGTKWKPDLPIESQIREQLADILGISDIYDRAVTALLFITKKQLFIDGNKRTSVVFANHILISQGAGLIVVPEDDVPAYKNIAQLRKRRGVNNPCLFIDSVVYIHCSTSSGRRNVENYTNKGVTLWVLCFKPFTGIVRRKRNAIISGGLISSQNFR